MEQKIERIPFGVITASAQYFRQYLDEKRDSILQWTKHVRFIHMYTPATIVGYYGIPFVMIGENVPKDLDSQGLADHIVANKWWEYKGEPLQYVLTMEKLHRASFIMSSQLLSKI